MEKKKYQIPALTVVALQQQAALMQASGNPEEKNDAFISEEFIGTLN